MFALGAGEKFDVNGTSEYVETIICELSVSGVHMHGCLCKVWSLGGPVLKWVWSLGGPVLKWVWSLGVLYLSGCGL